MTETLPAGLAQASQKASGIRFRTRPAIVSLQDDEARRPVSRQRIASSQ